MAFECLIQCGDSFSGIRSGLTFLAISAYFSKIYPIPKRESCWPPLFWNRYVSLPCWSSLKSLIYRFNISAVLVRSGTTLVLEPLPVSLIVGGALKRICTSCISDISCTLAAVSYITLNNAKSRRPYFVLIFGCSSNIFIPSTVKYFISGSACFIWRIDKLSWHCNSLSGIANCK